MHRSGIGVASSPASRPTSRARAVPCRSRVRCASRPISGRPSIWVLSTGTKSSRWKLVCEHSQRVRSNSRPGASSACAGAGAQHTTSRRHSIPPSTHVRKPGAKPCSGSRPPKPFRTPSTLAARSFIVTLSTIKARNRSSARKNRPAIRATTRPTQPSTQPDPHQPARNRMLTNNITKCGWSIRGAIGDGVEPILSGRRSHLDSSMITGELVGFGRDHGMTGSTAADTGGQTAGRLLRAIQGGAGPVSAIGCRFVRAPQHLSRQGRGAGLAQGRQYAGGVPGSQFGSSVEAVCSAGKSG